MKHVESKEIVDTSKNQDVTSRQIMKTTGITHMITLTRWHQMGLIPPPDVRTHPGGRGKMAYWPQWVLLRCVRIKRMRKAGKTLEEIKEFLGTDWETEAKRYKRPYVFQEVSQRMDFSAALMNLSDYCDRAVCSSTIYARDRYIDAHNYVASNDVLKKAVLLAEQGYNPVLIVDQDETHVAPDFMLSEYFARFSGSGRALLVIPLFETVSQQFSDLTTLPSSPTVRPSSKVVISAPDGDEERGFEFLSDWSFEIESPKRKRRKKAN